MYLTKAQSRSKYHQWLQFGIRVMIYITHLLLSGNGEESGDCFSVIVAERAGAIDENQCGNPRGE